MANPELSWPFNKIKKWNDAIWHTPLSELSRRKSFFIKQLRILVLAARNSLNDKVSLRASALTFYTLISIIPVVAIALAIAKGFGLDQNLESIIRNTKEFDMYGDFLNPLIESAKNTVQRTRGGYLAGIGVIILLWSVWSLLDQIETSFNHIWQTSINRPWYRKFTDYLTILLIAPILIIISSSITFFIITYLSEYMEKAPILASFKWMVSFLIKSAPYILTWLMLTLLFIVMPNVKVRFVPAMISGIIAGSLLKILQWLYLDLQYGITRLSAIYGGLAAIPLFLIFLETCWIVILLGAELSFANQNVSQYEFESEALNISHFQKRSMMLMIMYLIIKNFDLGEKPLNAEDISRKLKIPVRLARDILEDLTGSGLISVIHEHENKTRLYQPALDINKLTISFVLSRFDKKGTHERYVIKSCEYERLTEILDKYDRLMADSDSNILIKDL
ncbi:MAG TPA: YihY/virulence factor BrkB family protein [Bacteroidales bacterium]|nr:YihY/virulence factor BrkB family protein [Bacteroidales bacterium]